MPIITITKIICDGCGQEITEGENPVTMRDESGNTIYLHRFDCLKPYSESKQQDLDAKTTKSEQETVEAATQHVES